MFDIGVNLTSSQFAKDRDDVVARAFDAGVNGLLITGTKLRESQHAQKLARQYSSCWSTAGVHPHDSSQWQAATEEAIIELAAQPGKWWRLVNVASTLTATFRRRKSRNALLLPSYALPQN